MKEKVDLILKHEINCFINRYDYFCYAIYLLLRYHLKYSISIFCRSKHELVDIFVTSHEMKCIVFYSCMYTTSLLCYSLLLL